MPRRSELNGVASDIVRSFVSRNNDLRGYWALGMLCVYAKVPAPTRNGCIAPEKNGKSSLIGLILNQPCVITN